MPETDITRSKRILKATEDSVKSFFSAFDTVRQVESRPVRRAPTDAEQDLVRAGLVFAAAGLDASIKQLVRDSIRQLAQSDHEVQREFLTYVERQVRGPGDEVDNAGRHKFLAHVLSADSPRKQLIEDYIVHLTGDSLQSADQLFKVVTALGLNPQDMPTQKADLQNIFDVRNKIVHGLDVSFPGKRGRRNRNPRTKIELEDYSNNLIAVSKYLIKAVEDKIAGRSESGSQIQNIESE